MVIQDSDEFLIFSGEHTRENNFNFIIKQCENKNVRDIFFWCGMEYEPNGDIEISEYYKLNSFCNKNSITLYFIFSTNDYKFYADDLRLNQDNFRILYWPTHLLHYTFDCLIEKFNPIGNVKNKFEKIFLNFNNKPHYHRCLTVDKLYENGLNHYGKISWNNLTNQYYNSNDSHNYEFKFWNESIMKVDNFSYSDVTDDLLDTNTFMSLVSETTHDIFFVTEKTFRSLLIGQIFYCIGCKGQNSKLKDFGFELYDEIFDYTFDIQDSINERIEGSISNIKNLIGKDLNKLHVKVKDKIDYNKKRALEIVKDDPYIPIKFKEMFQKFPNKFYESNILNPTLKYNLSQQL
jgi:hypothetical protein